MPRSSPPAVPNELIEQKIYLIPGHKLMLDSDLAELYRVTTGNLNLAVRRNPKRFPEDFMFQLSREETQSLLLQNARAKGRGGRRTPPFAFTEQGVSMLSSVLNSERAIEVNIAIMRGSCASERCWPRTQTSLVALMNWSKNMMTSFVSYSKRSEN